jgi:ribosome-binding factor A
VKKQQKKSFSRESKVAATVRQFVAEIIRDVYSDLGITVVDARAHGGLQFVRIFYQGQRRDFAPLKDNIRWELAHRMNQKYVPDLEFVYDDTLEKAERIEELLRRA